MPCFIVDSMLGKLVKWLRIFGYDTVYFKKITPKSLVEIANSEKRIILTRNSRIYEIAKPNTFIYIHSIEPDEQIKQVVSHFNLDTKSNLFSICTVCNKKVEEINKENIKNKVPDYVFQEHSLFYICPICNRIYWQGSHYQNTTKKIEELFKET